MDALVLLIGAAMAGFSLVSAIREIRLYRRAIKGDELYLISRRRRNRRLFISLLLLVESAFLVMGHFFYRAENPNHELLYWVLPLAIIILLVHLSLQDFRETSRDIDRIFKEARNIALKTIEKNKR
jgi:hypothetical protein